MEQEPGVGGSSRRYHNTKVGAKPRDGSSNLMMFGRRMTASFRQRVYFNKRLRAV